MPATASHDYVAPPAGHPDPRSCERCGYGADAPQHPHRTDARITEAARLGRDLRAELVALVGEYPSDILSLVDGRVANILAVLDGQQPARFLIAGRRTPPLREAG